MTRRGGRAVRGLAANSSVSHYHRPANVRARSPAGPIRAVGAPAPTGARTLDAANEH